MENQNINPQPNTQPPAQPPQIITPPITSHEKASKLPLVLVFILFLASLSAAAYFFYQNQALKQQLSTLPLENEQYGTKNSVTPNPHPTTDWQTYSNENFTFKYPPILQLNENQDEIVLNHSIAYENYGDCDMTGGEVRLLSTLDDFNVSFKVISTPNPITNPEGTYPLGSIEGTWYTDGAEGCGNIIYYFPINSSQGLLITRARVQATSGIRTDINEVLAVPNVITKEENEVIFTQILSTFKFSNPSNTSSNQVI